MSRSRLAPPRSATCSRRNATPAVRTASAMRWASAALAAPGFSEGYVCPPAPVASRHQDGVVWRQTGAIRDRHRRSNASTVSNRGRSVYRCSRLVVPLSKAGTKAVNSTASNTCRSDSRQPIPCGWSMPRTAIRRGGHNQLGRHGHTVRSERTVITGGTGSDLAVEGDLIDATGLGATYSHCPAARAGVRRRG